MTRQRVIVALPLVLSLLAAGVLLWTRAEPSRQGSFCSRATVEAGRVLRAADGSVRVEYNLQAQIDAVLDLAYVAEVDRLIPGAPPDLKPKLEAASKTLPRYRKERSEAIAAGRPAPEPPAQLRETLLAFLVTYERDCV